MNVAAVAALTTVGAAPAWGTECAGAGDDLGDPDSVACGNNAFAGGNDSIALGSNANSGGDFSIAAGRNASSAGDYGTALGWSVSAGGASSTAVGDDASSAGFRSTALGYGASSGGASSTALGRESSSDGPLSLALGRSASSAGGRSTALGYVASAGGEFSTAVGAFAFADQPWTMVLGSIDGLNSAAEYTDVAIGTTTPLAPLHIARASGNAQLLVDNIDQATAEPRSMLELVNNGPIGFNMENVDTGQRWRFAAQTTGFRISLDGTGGPELEVHDNGNATLAGNLFTNSDVDAKQDIEPVAGETVLEKLERLPIAEWSYKDAADTRHLGPMAQDFRAAFGLGPDDTSIAPMDLAGVSLAAVKALKSRFEEKMSEKDRRIAELAEQNDRLGRRLSQLEAALRRAGSGIASN